jgi:site-specific DNA recombinase
MTETTGNLAAATPMRSRRGASASGGKLPASFRWGVYVRISDDRDGEAKGVGRQEEDGRERVAQRGGTVTELYAENDTSAFKKRRVTLRDDEGQDYVAYRVIRPVFQRMIRDLREGRIDGAMVYDLDRLARDQRDLEDCVEMVEHFGRVVESTTPGQVDLTNSNGITMARVLVAMANKSSADTARRTERAHYQAALEGQPVGGRRPFGWNDDKRTLSEREAEMIRDAVARILSGQKLHTVAQLWNESGMPTPRGKAVWRRSTLIEILTNARLCGLRTYHDEVMIGRDGKPVVGQWEPIITEAEWTEVCARLTRKSERPNRATPAGGTGRKYLWSGILRCGKPTANGTPCGTKLYGYPRPYGKPGFSYACPPKSDGGCGGLSVSGLHVDEFLEELVLSALDSLATDGGEPVTDIWGRAGDLMRARAVVKKVEEMFLDPDADMERAEYLRLRDEAKSKVSALEDERAEWMAAQAKAKSPARDWRGEWEGMTISQKHTAIAAAKLTAVIVKPSAARGRNTFDPNRLDPVWA